MAMHSDIEFERVGTMSFIYNRIFWIIPKFSDLKKNAWFRSAPFSSLGCIWHLQFRSFGSACKKDWLEIGVIHLSKTCALEKQRIRFGMAGSNLEISNTIDSSFVSRYSSLVLSSDLENEKDEWLPGGNLHLFFAIEIPNDDLKIGAIGGAKSKFGNEDFKEIGRTASIDAFSQTEEETGVWSLQQNLREILLNENVSDVILKVEGREFKAHRCILAARSPVFLAMMVHETKEKNTGVVDIEDVDSETLSDFLSYLYTGSMNNITSQNVVKLYTAADKYQVYELKKVCTDYMLNNICIDNFCDILTLALRHVEKDLTNACTQFFVKNSLSIVLTSKWQVFLGENPVAGNELYIKQLQMNK